MPCAVALGAPDEPMPIDVDTCAHNDYEDDALETEYITTLTHGLETSKATWQRGLVKYFQMRHKKKQENTPSAILEYFRSASKKDKH